MTPFLSEKLRNLSALAILMVLYIHMYYIEDASMHILSDVQNIVGSNICSAVAVPMFFAISGYLFFISIPNGVHSIFQKMKKRVRTLIIPYILANAFTFLFYVTLNFIASIVPAIDALINFKILDDAESQGLIQILKLVFIDPPIAFQLWFLRDLIIVIACSPIIWCVLRIFGRIRYGIPILGILITIAYIFMCYNGCIKAFLWFTGGGCIAMSNLRIVTPSNYKITTIICMFIYMAICVYNGINNTRIIPLGVQAILGVVAVWLMYDLIHPYADSKVSVFTKYTFFIYLIHEPFLNIFKKLPLLIDKSELMLVCCYIIVPIIFYVLTCGFGCLLKQYIPKLYHIYTGGR